jgi:hypothetical protein
MFKEGISEIQNQCVGKKNSRNKIIYDLYKGINEFKKAY